MPLIPLSLLSTKLNRPPATADQVDRPRLIAMLDRGLSGPLTVVSAAAGFGKTTLVSSWIETLNAPARPVIPSAWLSLDPRDSDLGVFLRYLVAGIRAACPGACPESLALLKAPAPPSQAPLLITIANEIESLPDRLVLVLDDYHVIHGEEVHDFVSELLRYWPVRLHLVVISRTSPPLPLSVLRAKGRLTEIRTRDLRFTPEESAAFLSKTLPAPLSQSTIDLLDQRLEGWIAGLRLATLSLSTGTDTESELAALSGTHVEIAEYLIDEVLSCQTRGMLRFMLATSIFGRFCAELCEYALAAVDGLGGCDDGCMERSGCDVAGCIRWLEKHNLFVSPLDNEGKWYRYHHLFQELLQRRLAAELSPEQITALHRAAASWLTVRGMIDEALHHALIVEDLDLTASIMVAGLRDVLNREDRATLDRWLNLLPEDFIRHHPWLLMIKALALQFSFRLTAVWKLLGQIETLLDERGGRAPAWDENQDLRPLRGLLAVLHGQRQFHQSQAGGAIASCEEALALLPEGWRYPRGAARLYWGFSMRAIGQADAAHQVLLDDFESLTVKTDAYALRLPWAIAFNSLETGHLEQAKRMAQMMVDLSAPDRLMILKGFGHYCLGIVHYCWNDLEAAAEQFQRVIDMRYATHTQAARSNIIGMAHVHMAKGETDKAWEMVDLLSQLDMERAGAEGDDARSLRAQLAYLEGDSEAAFRWADGYPAAVPDRLLNWYQDPHLVKVSLLVARGAEPDLEVALEILDALNTIAERSYCAQLQTTILAVRSVALEKQGRSVPALSALEHAVGNARISGSVRIFVDQGATMQTLLLRLAGRGFALDTVRRILAAFPQPGEKTEPAVGTRARAANADLIDPLTERELDVLVLLRERMSNKEIAQHLDLSIMTVKRHTCNIYSKLDVDNRRDAVVKAETLKVLPSV